MARGLDALAVEWLALVPALDFRVAESASEREAYFRLRYDVVVDEGWVAAEDLPGGRESDAYDDAAVHLLAWDGSTLAAGMRLLFPQPWRLLPTEAEYGLTIYPPGRVVNLDRLGVRPEYRDGDTRMVRAMLGAYWQAIRARGLTVTAGIVSALMRRFYRRLGFEVDTLGPGRTYWGQLRYPVRVTPSDAVLVVRGEPGRWREEWLRAQREQEGA